SGEAAPAAWEFRSSGALLKFLNAGGASLSIPEAGSPCCGEETSGCCAAIGSETGAIATVITPASATVRAIPPAAIRPCIRLLADPLLPDSPAARLALESSLLSIAERGLGGTRGRVWAVAFAMAGGFCFTPGDGRFDAIAGSS
ncbi:MAG: hypothetical protein WCA11_14500, partial [Terracidiphilus sp.]